MAKKKATKKTPTSPRLPGVDDGEIVSLENLAEEYATIRDDRMALSQAEIRLKGELLAEMKRLKKKRYHRNGITISVVVEAEGVKVKVKPPATEADEADED